VISPIPTARGRERMPGGLHKFVINGQDFKLNRRYVCDSRDRLEAGHFALDLLVCCQV
jgi:hypothetical protein